MQSRFSTPKSNEGAGKVGAINVCLRLTWGGPSDADLEEFVEALVCVGAMMEAPGESMHSAGSAALRLAISGKNGIDPEKFLKGVGFAASNVKGRGFTEEITKKLLGILSNREKEAKAELKPKPAKAKAQAQAETPAMKVETAKV